MPYVTWSLAYHEIRSCAQNPNADDSPSFRHLVGDEKKGNPIWTCSFFCRMRPAAAENSVGAEFNIGIIIRQDLRKDQRTSWIAEKLVADLESSFPKECYYVFPDKSRILA